MLSIIWSTILFTIRSIVLSITFGPFFGPPNQLFRSNIRSTRSIISVKYSANPINYFGQIFGQPDQLFRSTIRSIIRSTIRSTIRSLFSPLQIVPQTVLQIAPPTRRPILFLRLGSLFGPPRQNPFIYGFHMANLECDNSVHYSVHYSVHPINYFGPLFGPLFRCTMRSTIRSTIRSTHSVISVHYSVHLVNYFDQIFGQTDQLFRSDIRSTRSIISVHYSVHYSVHPINYFGSLFGSPPVKELLIEFLSILSKLLLLNIFQFSQNI
jgi:hypothetical protein